MHLTPLIVARSQLLTAIDLFFTDADAVSVHGLAGNAREILESLCRLAEIEPMTDFILKDHPGRQRKDIWTAMNLYRNCFKHVGRTPEKRTEDQATLDQFHEPVNEFLLYVCVEDYIRLRKAMPVPFQIFQLWFVAMHSDLLVSGKDPEKFLSAFPGLSDLDRVSQKSLGQAKILEFLNDETLLYDPRTEPLVICQ